MILSWKRIHDLEVREDYPAAIDALEERLNAFPSDKEVVIRLGFNLWYAVAEEARLRRTLPTESYVRRFVELFRTYQPQLEDDADFCWAFGLGISLDGHLFPGLDERVGEILLGRARELDHFYVRMQQEEMNSRFRGRGIFASYYGIS
jgi:hypothetical protein